MDKSDLKEKNLLNQYPLCIMYVLKYIKMKIL